MLKERRPSDNRGLQNARTASLVLNAGHVIAGALGGNSSRVEEIITAERVSVSVRFYRHLALQQGR